MSYELVLEGVIVKALTPHDDDRGSFTEMFREEWHFGPKPVQWNMVRSRANVLRGVHLHRRHADYLTMAAGEMVLGLRDLRRGSPTQGRAVTLHLTARAPQLVVIPPGVAHGFYFPTESCHVYAVSHYFDKSDELGCRWDDPALCIPWPCKGPMLSPRDDSAGTLAEMIAVLEVSASGQN